MNTIKESLRKKRIIDAKNKVFQLRSNQTGRYVITTHQYMSVDMLGLPLNKVN